MEADQGFFYEISHCQPAMNPAPATPDQPRLRILLVDDDKDEYFLTGALLADRSLHSVGEAQLGYELAWVGSFTEALEAFEQDDFAVYLIDYRLGENNGLELLKELRQRGCQAPIILMTGYGSYQLDVEAMQVGATDYLAKAEVTAALLERTIRYALEQKRAEEEIRWHAVRAELLAGLAQTFAGAGLDYPAVLDTIAGQIAAKTGKICLIHLLEASGQALNLAAGHHLDPAVRSGLEQLSPTLQLLTGPDPINQLLKTGEPLLLAQQELQRQAVHWPWIGELGLQNAWMLPLRAGGRTFGVLSLLCRQADQPLLPDDRQFYKELAVQAALALENARLYAAESSRARELAALQKATAALLITIDLEALLSQILDIAQEAIPAAESGVLYLMVPKTGQLKVRAISGYTDQRIKKLVASQSRGYLAHCVETRLPLLVTDALGDSTGLEDESQLPEAAGLANSLNGAGAFRSALFAPLVLEGEIMGVLMLNASQPSAFTEPDLHLLVSFAATTTAALENAKLHAEVQRSAITDPLTEVFNRRGFFELGLREVERARRFERQLSVLMLDLDEFKQVNDAYGHAAGDHVLQVQAARLRSSIREVDVLGRYGGDEFVILLPETNLFKASQVAERMRRIISEPIAHQSANGVEQISVTASIGITRVRLDGDSLTNMLERADTAAYRAKHAGRNRVEIG
jgi:diguanylate cyclase (GGDEF)-like protein